MVANWDKFEVLKVDYDCEQHAHKKGVKNGLCGQVIIDKKDMKGDLGVECVVVQYNSANNKAQFLNAYEFDLVKEEGTKLYFEMHETFTILEYINMHCVYILRMQIFLTEWTLLMFVG